MDRSMFASVFVGVAAALGVMLIALTVASLVTESRAQFAVAGGVLLLVAVLTWAWVDAGSKPSR